MIPVILYSAVGYTILATLTIAAPSSFPPPNGRSRRT